MFLNEQREEYLVHALFAEPLYQSKVKVDSNKVLKYLRGLEYIDNRYNRSTENTYILDEPELSDLKEEVIRHLNLFIRDFLNYDTEFKITQSWANITKNGEHHHPHNHPNGVYSGVLYFSDVPNFEFSDLSFLREQPIWDFSVSEDGWNWANSDSYRIKPSNCTIFMFRGKMKHMVEINESVYDRHNIAFNAFPTGEFGSVRNFTKTIL